MARNYLLKLYIVTENVIMLFKYIDAYSGVKLVLQLYSKIIFGSRNIQKIDLNVKNLRKQLTSNAKEPI